MLHPQREEVSQDGGLVHTVHVRERVMPDRWHWHPEAELTLIVSGRGQRFVGASVQPYGPGDWVLLGGGVPHLWVLDTRRGEAGETGGIEAWVAQFDSDRLGRDVLSHADFAGVRALLQSAERGLLIGAERWRQQERDRLARAMRAMHNGGGARRVLGLLELLAEISETATESLDPSGFASQTRRHNTTRLDPVWALLAERWDQPITLDDAASATHLTPSAFARLFKRTMGKTFIQYLHELRIAHACQALTGTDQPVTRIAADAGFTNLSNFNRVFRRLRGCSPREFRRGSTGPNHRPPPATSASRAAG
ncbi:MAG: AraC family transcriptional regulator [Planctomycetota bacterium]